MIKRKKAISDRLGRYRIIAKLASGGMATVYLAQAEGVGGFSRTVALKACHPHLADDPAFRSMFLREARLAAQIHHPNVVATIDVGADDDLYLVMEYVEGGRLSDLLMQDGQIPAPIALAILRDTLRGLHAAHTTTGNDGAGLHIIHRDVSPHNLMIGIDGVTRVVDFGIAKARTSPKTTASGVVKGKLAYMAPEQMREGAVTPAVDVFAAGVVAWELFAGRPLFAGDSEADTIQRVLYIPIPKLPELAIPHAHELRAVIMKALRRDPAERYDSAAEFAQALEQLGLPIASPATVGGHVQKVLSEEIAERRALLQASLDKETLSESHSSKNVLYRTLPFVLILLVVLAVAFVFLSAPETRSPPAQAQKDIEPLVGSDHKLKAHVNMADAAQIVQDAATVETDAQPFPSTQETTPPNLRRKRPRPRRKKRRKSRSSEPDNDATFRPRKI